MAECCLTSILFFCPRKLRRQLKNPSPHRRPPSPLRRHSLPLVIDYLVLAFYICFVVCVVICF
ncbi:hypothetical protein OIU74_029584 [Salix koriyanagi]|uniref:Transmembrane protein n=1 Tax=Salix koriyanagi TaxID=2511006 RepID=A0A9Q0VEZ4_9ROSI|nr:hypothetical protein OIU74_029584 [Salix koriyanagi]